MQIRGAVLAGCLLVACGDDAARVRLVPVSPCGQIENETALRIVAFTASGEQRRTVPPTDIDSFPADTEQLAAEVVGESGRLVAIGKTAPLVFDDLADGAEIPIVMAPLDGFCPVGPMTEPRHAPSVARAGGLVLVVGGTGVAGEQLATAEVYDPATATFSPVLVPPTLMDPVNGLAGAVLTELADGRVVLTGTSAHALAYFDPETRRFSTPNLFDNRAFHGALAVDDDRLLVIGGCFDVVDGACSGPSLRTGFFYELADLTVRERGPSLDASAVRHGARIHGLGEQADGVVRYVLAGGVGEPGAGDLFALGDPMAARVTGLAAQVTSLDGGALLSAFAPDGMTASGTATVLAPGATQGVAIAPAPALASARMLTLEDGSVLAIGDQVARYQPTSNTWRTETPAGMPPAALAAPSLVRLGDGSVLVVGGAATADAWIYRPSLVGPTSGSVFVLPGGGVSDAVLTPVDPTLVDRSGGAFVLVASDDGLGARALVGGPRMTQGSVTAIVRVLAGGVALIAEQTGPGRALAGRLVPGQPARIVQLAGGTESVLCAGAMVGDTELASTTVTLGVRDGMATLSVGAAGAATVMARCMVPQPERGAWGIAATGAGARVEVGPLEVARAQ